MESVFLGGFLAIHETVEELANCRYFVSFSIVFVGNVLPSQRNLHARAPLSVRQTGLDCLYEKFSARLTEIPV